MSYIDAIHDKKKDKIVVSERINGKRMSNHVNPIYEFYMQDEYGEYTGERGERLKKFTFKNGFEFYKEIKNQKSLGHKLYESDHNVLFKTLNKHYQGTDAPKLNTCFLDIEVDVNPDIGFPEPDKAELPINAITFYCSWNDRLITLVLRPKTLTDEEGQAICDKFDDTIMCKDEAELLDMSIKILDEADIISGWNSSFFDLPYIINRIKQVLGARRTKELCLWGKEPQMREVRRFKGSKTYQVYSLIGKAHIDYLELYQKHTPKQKESYSLDSIAEAEVGEKKVEYSGTFETLYNDAFETFIAYNRQDTMLIKKIDDKLHYIELANQVSHTNLVTLEATMGTVSWVDQAIINEAHKHNIIKGDKVDEDPTKEHRPAAGAWVAEPKLGLHKMIGCTDINSLYPSAIRSLNMSPETILGQLRPDYTEAHLLNKIETQQLYKHKGRKEPDWAAAWGGLFQALEVEMVWNKTDDKIWIDFEDSDSVQLTAKEVYELIFEQSNGSICMSANGTLFNTDTKGIIPSVLEKWYSERVEMKKKMKKCFKEGNETEGQYWHLQQYVRKIQLNSLYGCLLQNGSKFYDNRLGQSTTLTGRCITRFMTAKVNELITGKFDEFGDACIAGDTDSTYFSIQQYYDSIGEKTVHTKEDVLDLYLYYVDRVNELFPTLMDDKFNTGMERGGIIVAGLEMIGETGLWVAKKRYGILMYWDDEHGRLDTETPGELKVKGLDLLRSDTPKVVKVFLKGVLNDILIGKTEEDVQKDVIAFKQKFSALEPWSQGSPKSVKGLDEYGEKLLDNPKQTLPGHVRASMNWNQLREIHNDKVSMQVLDGSRIVVCKLKMNPTEMTSVAYPSDEHNLPNWFKKLPFDKQSMKDSVLIKKLENITGVLDWNLKIDEGVVDIHNFMFG